MAASVQRILRLTPTTVTVVFLNDETPVDADGAVTVTITKADGTTLVTNGATVKTSTGTYTYTLAGQANLTALTLDWTGTFGALSRTVTTFAEIVGNRYFTLTELRESDTALSNNTTYPTTALSAARDFVETEFEDICNQAFVPRGNREVLSGDGTYELWLSKPNALEVTKLVIDGDDVTSTVSLRRSDESSRILIIRDQVWPVGEDNIVIEYEYGMYAVPQRVKDAAFTRARNKLASRNARIDERSTSIQIDGFGTFSIAQPGMRGSQTGIPAVDKVLFDYTLEPGGVR